MHIIEQEENQNGTAVKEETQPDVQEKQPAAKEELPLQKPPVPPPPAEKSYILTEGVANELLRLVSNLPWKDANPIIALIQQNFKENK